MQLHCPKCGDVLAENADGHLACLRGRMELADELEERLRECYAEQTRTPPTMWYSLMADVRPVSVAIGFVPAAESQHGS